MGYEGYGGIDDGVPNEADANVCGVAVDAPVVNEFASNPTTWVDGSEIAGKCNVGCTRLEAAPCLAIYGQLASRNGPFPSTRR